MRIRSKLFLGISLIVVPILLISFTSIFLIEKRVEDFGKFHTPALFLIQDITTDALKAHEESFAYIASGEKGEKDEFLKWAEDYHIKLVEFKVLSEQIIAREHVYAEVEEREPNLILKIEASHANVVEKAKVMFDEFETRGSLSNKVFTDYENTVEMLFTDLNELIRIEKLDVDESQESAIGIIALNKKVILSVGFLGFLLAIVSAYFLNRSISTPIAKLKAAADKIASGRFETRIEMGSSDELSELAADFNSMASRLQETRDELLQKERLAALGDLTATISHELRNPLGTISTSFYSIDKQIRGANDRLDRALDRVKRNIARCDDIIGGLLDYTREKDLVIETVPFHQWMSDFLDEYSLPEGVTLNKSIATDLEIPLDKEKFRQVLINVLDNGCHAMEENSGNGTRASVLTVNTSLGHGRLEVRVSDTGVGIPEENLEKIFEPLFSGKTVGVGLGLTLVKKIMTQHGGGIEVSSEVGRGTEMILWLPRGDDGENRDNPDGA